MATKPAKISRGSWCLTFGFSTPTPLDVVVKALSAFGYDGIELQGWEPHVTLERYPDKASRRKLRDEIAGYGLELVGYAPGPYGDFGKYAWATDDDAHRQYLAFFRQSLQLCADMGIPVIRVDPGNFGPLPREADYNRAWDRVVTTFRQHAEEAANLGVKVAWEPETGQIFVKPSEVVKLISDVGNNNFGIIYDCAHIQAMIALAHNQVQPFEKIEAGQGAFIRMLPKGSIFHMHMTDNDNETWHNAFGRHLGLGKGVLNFDEIITAVLDNGYDSQWWSVDAIPMTEESWTYTYTDIAILRGLLDKYVNV